MQLFVTVALPIILVLTSAGPTMVSAEGTCSTMTTFNAGMLERIPYYSARRERIPPALVAEGSDVICAQEYWFEKDVVDLLDGVSSEYPYHYTQIHYKVGQLSRWPWYRRWIARTSCSLYDQLYFSTRVLPCATLSGCLADFQTSLEKGMVCLTTRCAALLKYQRFNPDCFSCITMTTTSIETMFDSCRMSVLDHNNRLNGAGLVLLSKKKITSAAYRDYFPGKRLTLQRGYIEAEIEDIGKVVCTHMTALFTDYFEYDLPFSNYLDQQRAEINVLDNKFGLIDHILIGDLNTGPVVSDPNPEKTLAGEGPQNFQLFVDTGYDMTPYFDNDGRCTYCIGNRNVIDFIVTKGTAFNITDSQRTLDPPIPLTLSDHYGVRANVCTRE